MIKKILCIMALVAGVSASAQVAIHNEVLGSGTPGSAAEFEKANRVDVGNDIFHAPQTMPGFPTASTIWPRVVEVPCTKINGELKCEGYHWAPKLGRGEYLFFTPKIVVPPKAEIIMVPGPSVLVEVPAKKKSE